MYAEFRDQTSVLAEAKEDMNALEPLLQLLRAFADDDEGVFDVASSQTFERPGDQRGVAERKQAL